jgi:membrane protein EpsK
MPNLPENRKPAQEGASPGDRELSQSLLSQFPKNLVSSILLFLVHLASGLWVTPFLIHSLGVAAFGLVPLANSITRFLTLATMGVSIGLSRFLTIDLQQKDHRRANRTFNTGFWTLAAVIAALVPLLAAFTQYVPVLFEIPADQGASAKILFAGVFGASLLTVLSGCFAASAPACNRLDLRN